jgi:hypothetical protein
MIKDCDEKLLKKFDYNQDYLWVYNSAHGKSGGILCGVKKDLYDVGSFQQGEYMLQMNLWDKMNRIKWNFLVVYGAADEENKLDFLSELSSFCSRNKEPILIGGDFNILRYSSERNRPGGNFRHSDTFNNLIHFYELRELLMFGGLYTRSNNQDIPTLEKLDIILVFKEWEDLFPNTLVKKLPREVSDHNPLILSTASSKPTLNIQFRFELSWLNNPEFLPTVEKIWSKPCRAKTVLDKIEQKLKSFKQYFKGWRFNLQGESRKKKELYQ